MEPSPSAAAGAPDARGPAGLAAVELSPERIQLSGLRTARTVRAPFGGELRAVGAVAASERGQGQVTTRFAGWIEQLLVEETGRVVRKGQALATIYSPDVLRAEQEYLTARKWAEAPRPAGDGAGAPSLAADARRRLELLGVDGREIDDLSSAAEPPHAVTLRSPVTGTVLRKAAIAGAYVQPGSELFAVADLSTVWMVAEVPEQAAGRVRAGQAARIELDAFPGRPFAGRVQLVSPTVDADSRTLRVRVELRNADGALRPGMYGTVFLEAPQREALVVPAEAVVDTGDARYVFVARGEGRFEPRAVEVGDRQGGRAEIRAGLAEGELVVTTANFLLDSESRLRAAVEGSR
jgi:Cu(I)/Ag(I) efflux system membrane fusion protein